MLRYDNCPNCFNPLGGGIVCRYCGHNYTQGKNYAGVLPAFTVLNGRYITGRVLGKGGFGITYVAMDMQRNRTCAIKEYMPSEYATRGEGLSIAPYSDDKSRFVFTHGREKFIDEAKTLIKLRSNPIVVDILDFFTQNNTGYLVMEFLNGENLRQMSRARGGTLDPELAKMIFLTVASSLMEIHRMNILHRDLSPENIIYTSDGRVKLIDFGAARNFVSTQNKGMSILLKPGFAPPEQYEKKGEHGPWSDVYALCATYYTLVSGKPLVDALFRYRGEKQPSLYALGCPVTKKTSDVIERGMELDYRRRYRDFRELMDDIDIAGQQPAKPIKRIETPPANPVINKAAMGNVPPQVGASARPAQTIQPYVAAMMGNSLCNRVMVGSKDLFKIGRSNISCQYVVSGDTNISRIHCYLRVRGNKIYLVDASSNGTFFEDGRQLVKNKEYLVNPGTKFYLATRNHMLIVNI